LKGVWVVGKREKKKDAWVKVEYESESAERERDISQQPTHASLPDPEQNRSLYSSVCMNQKVVRGWETGTCNS